MTDEEISGLYQQYQLDPTPENKYAYRHACLRAGLKESIGFEVGDFVRVLGGSDEIWLKGKPWTGYIANFRFQHWPGEIPAGWEVCVLPVPKPKFAPYEDGRKVFDPSYHPRGETYAQYLLSQGGLLLSQPVEIIVLRVADPNSNNYKIMMKRYLATKNIIENRPSPESYLDADGNPLRTQFRLSDKLSWDEWQDRFIPRVRAEVTFHEGSGKVTSNAKPTRSWIDNVLAQMSQPNSNQTLALISINSPSDQLAPTTLIVSGGQNGIFMVGAECPSGWRNLMTPGQQGQTFNLVAGGQEADYPGEACTTLEVAKQAVDYFLNTKDLDPRLTWDS